MRHSTRATRALAHLPDVDPGIAALALWCTHRDGPLATQTDGDTITYGPSFALLPLPEQVGVLAHHVLHVALRHSSRRAEMARRLGSGFQPDLYDLACDALVNEALLQGGHALPRPCVRALELVTRLPAEARPKDVLAEWDCDQLYFALAANAQSQSGADKQDASQTSIRAYAKAQGFEPDLGESDPDAKDGEIWSGRVRQALASGRAAGAGIGAALTRFGDLPKARIAWEVHLRRRIARALTPTPRLSHRRPATAWLARDADARQTSRATPAFQPGLMRDDRRLRLVVGLDTSSSIHDDELALFAAEALALVRRSGAEAHLLGFDTEVHHRGLLDRSLTRDSLKMRRGGGTDFDAVLSEAQAMQPTLIIMMTDLDAPLTTPPQAPVIWAVPHAPARPPHFGEIIVMRGEN